MLDTEKVKLWIISHPLSQEPKDFSTTFLADVLNVSFLLVVLAVYHWLMASVRSVMCVSLIREVFP